MKKFVKLNQKRKRGIHRTKRSLKMNIKEFFYPSIGVKAWVRFIFLSLNRKPLSSHKIALGFAVGVFVSFTPYLGLHGLFAILIASILSASVFAALMGTLVGNPWTFPLIFKWTSKIGHIILNQAHPTNSLEVNLPPLVSFSLTDGFTMSFSLEKLFYCLDKYLLPMTVGGTLLGILFGLIFYFIIKCHINNYRAVRQARLEKARAKIRARRIQKIKKSLKLK
ncbi:MAG: DUF2062 domain-containing protein [Proteobacteria bacterium]|nr:DUF2062 domain-containing protein [Pseudomonadota bacterium]